ncbi:hypothetical protein EDB84DRAFT_1488845 [Lactarius hengduanensis]|nr:hypothetical protein EDB84DRAFT_1488845 [Lactarius hengduanensis]
MGPETPFPAFQLEYTTPRNILIDGRNIKTLGLADRRRATAILFQDYIHFPLSLHLYNRVRQWDLVMRLARRLSGRRISSSPLIMIMHGPLKVGIKAIRESCDQFERTSQTCGFLDRSVLVRKTGIT